MVNVNSEYSAMLIMTTHFTSVNPYLATLAFKFYTFPSAVRNFVVIRTGSFAVLIAVATATP